MPKFVLLDPSLHGIGGHHLEYALHVLRAAEKAGFDPWVATHRKFREIDKFPPHWRVLPTYQRGIYTKRRFLADGDPPLTDAPGRSWAVRLLAAWWNDHRRAKRSSMFSRDTAALVRQLALAPGDQVFLPTVSELELLGLAQNLANGSTSFGVDWHLQFHFPIYAGYEPDYPAQETSIESLRRCFRKALALAADHRIHFYTTTEGLAVQYSRLGVAQFQALPYPANPALQTSRTKTLAAASPLRIAYLGDARHEKGYQLLPQIINSMWNEFVATNRIRFVIQSDCNFPQPAQSENNPVAESKAALARFGSEKITLVDEPLDTAAFTQQTLQCDIGLLPYDRAAYCVRCSGVLVDLLSIGIPLVVPAGTWLADQLAEPTREYHVGLRHGPRVCGRTTVRSGTRLAVPDRASDMLLYLRWPVDLKLCAGAYAAVETKCLGSGGEELSAWPHVVGPGRPDRLSTALVRLPQGTKSVSLQWQNAYGTQPVDFREVEAFFLSADGSRQTPRGAVGLVAADAAQVPAQLAEIVEHYAHYRQTALNLSRRWIEWHNPERVVAEILSQRPSIPLPGSNFAPHIGAARRAIRR